jgi:hypothetical protein
MGGYKPALFGQTIYRRLVLSKRNQGGYDAPSLGDAQLLSGRDSSKIHAQVLPELSNSNNIRMLFHVAQCSTFAIRDTFSFPATANRAYYAASKQIYG